MAVSAGGYTAATKSCHDRLVRESKNAVSGGIVAKKKGYHSSRRYNRAYHPTNYSIRHPLDQRGPDDVGAGIDITFRDALSGDFSTIALHSMRLYIAGKRKDPRLRGWVEFFGNIDMDRTVEGCNFRTGNDAISDISHTWHAHLSESREMTPEWINKNALESVWFGQSLEDWVRTIGFPGFAGVELYLGTWSASVFLAQRWVGGLVLDGEYGPASEIRFKAFQRDAGLQPDGRIGPMTWAALRAKAIKDAAPPPPPPPPPPGLPITGLLDRPTIERWQRVMVTPVDGVLEQPGSHLVMAVQKHLNARINAALEVNGDGIYQNGVAYPTVAALQQYLGVPVTGRLSTDHSATIVRLQERLSAWTF